MTPFEQLCEKMRQEQNKYYDWLTAQPPEEILRHAYEYSVREDIILATEEMHLTPAQVRALLKSPAPLADLYKDFSKLETDYMSIVAQCIEDRADDLLKREMQQNPPKVYRQSISYARQHDEVQQYKESYRLNERCGDEINGAIAFHYDGMHLDDGAVKQVVEEFGLERTKYVLAAAIQIRDGMVEFPAQMKRGQILCAPSRTWTSAGLTGLATMQVCKPTPVCWTVSQTKCENLKKPKTSPPKIPPKDNRSVCILQALFS